MYLFLFRISIVELESGVGSGEVGGRRSEVRVEGRRSELGVGRLETGAFEGITGSVSGLRVRVLIK